MNKITFRMRGSKKAVTPVIATIILIAGTLVLALVVGAYTFGLFGSNVKTVTLSSATLYGGNASPTVAQGAATGSYITFSLNNPGSASTVSSMTLTGSGIQAVTVWDNSTFAGTCSGACASVFSGTSGGVANNLLAGGKVSSYTWYLGGQNQAVTTGQTFNYVINFANGQSVSGSLIAQ
jgi:flagellin-like protein